MSSAALEGWRASFPARGSTLSLIVSLLACSAVAIGFAAASPANGHWFLVPVTLCGALAGADALDWLRGRRDRLDPFGLLGLFGVHFFFLSPLLHVHWDYWLLYVAAPGDWRPWLGLMASLNLLGLVAYRFSRHLRLKTPPEREWTVRWTFVGSRLRLVLPAFLLLTGGLQLWVYQSQGSILGYIQAFEDSAEAFRGMGWVFVISESFPVIAFISFTVLARRYAFLRRWTPVVVALALFFVAKMIFGGLRGSRANTIWAMFWAAGIVHLMIRPISRKFIAVGVAGMLLFVYAYGFYKGVGTEALTALQGAEARADLESRTRRSVEGNVLGEFARADVQAFLLYRLLAAEGDYPLAMGRTYVGALAQLVPESIWAGRPPTKVKEGTELQYGRDTYNKHFYSVRQYGVGGEALLNFGPMAVPFAYLLFGLGVGGLRRASGRLAEGDTRLYLLPFMTYLTFVCLLMDSDNITIVLIKNGVIPLALIALCSRRERVPATEASA